VLWLGTASAVHGKNLCVFRLALILLCRSVYSIANDTNFHIDRDDTGLPIMPAACMSEEMQVQALMKAATKGLPAAQAEQIRNGDVWPGERELIVMLREAKCRAEVFIFDGHDRSRPMRSLGIYGSEGPLGHLLWTRGTNDVDKGHYQRLKQVKPDGPPARTSLAPAFASRPPSALPPVPLFIAARPPAKAAVVSPASDKASVPSPLIAPAKPSPSTGPPSAVPSALSALAAAASSGPPSSKAAQPAAASPAASPAAPAASQQLLSPAQPAPASPAASAASPAAPASSPAAPAAKPAASIGPLAGQSGDSVEDDALALLFLVNDNAAAMQARRPPAPSPHSHGKVWSITGQEQPGPDGRTLGEVLHCNRPTGRFTVEVGDVVLMRSAEEAAVAMVGYVKNGSRPRYDVGLLQFCEDGSPALQWEPAKKIDRRCGKANLETVQQIVALAQAVFCHFTLICFV
jgi:hypothetical protein